MTSRPCCESDHTDRAGYPSPRHAEYRCTVCGRAWCAGCLQAEYHKGGVRWVCGDGECMGEVEGVG